MPTDDGIMINKLSIPIQGGRVATPYIYPISLIGYLWIKTAGWPLRHSKPRYDGCHPLSHLPPPLITRLEKDLPVSRIESNRGYMYYYGQALIFVANSVRGGHHSALTARATSAT